MASGPTADGGSTAASSYCTIPVFSYGNGGIMADGHVPIRYSHEPAIRALGEPRSSTDNLSMHKLIHRETTGNIQHMYNGMAS